MIDRVKRLLGYAKLEGCGLEIGPLDKPLVPRDGKNTIYYADYSPQETLRERSQANVDVDCEKIPVIDFVTPNVASYSNIALRFDYIIASHVIEHTPDVLGWIEALLKLLKEDGRLILAIPDRRYMFDYYRSESTFGEALEAYLERRERPSVRQAFDGHGGARKVDTIALWSGAPEVMPEPYFPAKTVFEIAKQSFETKSHTDCHCWVFTIDSFLSLLERSKELGILRVDVVAADPPEKFSNEFHIVLSK